MRRKDEIKESIEGITHIMDVVTKAELTQEQITNINLAAITNQLADISITLAIIADELGGECEEEKEDNNKKKEGDESND